MSGSKPIPFPYKNNKVVPWRYAPQKPSERKEKAINTDSLSAKVTNIIGISRVTHSGCIFAAPDLPVRPANAKGKAKMIVEEANEARRFAEKGEDSMKSGVLRGGQRVPPYNPTE